MSPTNQKKQEEIAWIRRKLQEMNQPGYYGAWCAGYYKMALKEKLERLTKELNDDGDVRQL